MPAMSITASSPQTATDVRKRLAPLIQKTQGLQPQDQEAERRLGEPSLLAEVEYREVGRGKAATSIIQKDSGRIYEPTPDRSAIAVRAARGASVVLAKYVEPGARNGDNTVENLLDILDRQIPIFDIDDLLQDRLAARFSAPGLRITTCRC
jgi:hypothetical protein